MADYIDKWSAKDFEQHIHDILGWTAEVIKVEIAGDGNMNFTFRLKFNDGRSVIIKQSPPYCARFPHIPAPEGRIFSEFKYYQMLEGDDFLISHSPELLGLDQTRHIAYMSDLGAATDFEYLYRQHQKLDRSTCEKLVRYLILLHRLEFSASTRFENRQMRDLNHDYIFKLPFEADNNAIDLDKITPGLNEVTAKLIHDDELAKAAENLGKLYYQSTGTLIHGDYYPMSWINTEKGLFVIDPEFGFMGLAEIDLGVFLAHMLLSGNFPLAYGTIKKLYGLCDWNLAAKFCAVEVIRRICYVSQLPIINSLAFKQELLSKSARVLLSGEMEIYEKPDTRHI